MAPASERPERLLDERLECRFTTAEDAVENRDLVAVDAGSGRPWRGPPVEREELLDELADALLRAGQPNEDARTGRLRAKGVLRCTCGYELIEARKVPVHRPQRNVGSLGNVRPTRTEDAFLSMESDRGVHDASASLRVGGGSARHPVSPRSHDLIK